MVLQRWERFSKENVLNLDLTIGRKTFEIYHENNFSYLDPNETSQIKNNNNSNLVASTGREEINFKNIELSRIFMAWSIPSLKNQKMNMVQ